MAGLEVQIGADNSEFKKKIQEVEHDIKELSNVKLEKIKLGLDTTEINAQIKDAKKHLSELKTISKDTGNAIGGMAPKVANGGNALMQFSRIAQDAPFGIMGIGNNITSTVEAFGHLKNSTGSTGSALKAMASSIMGSGGILLGVSLLTTGLTIMSQQGLSVGDVFNKITGSFDNARKAAQDLNAEAIKGSQAQVSSMNAYVSVASNVNLSMNDRLIAVRKLQDEYPGYFGNLTKEQILNGNVAGAVRGVTAALIAKAKAASLTDRIVKLAEAEEGIQNKINDAITTQLKFYKLSKKEAFDVALVLNKQLRGEIDLMAELSAGRANDLSKTEKTALAAFRYSQTLQGLGVELRKSEKDQDDLTNSLNKTYGAFIKLETAQAPKASKTPKTFNTPQVSGINSTIDAQGLADTSGEILQIAKNVQGAEGLIATSMNGIKVAFDSNLIASLERIKEFNDQARTIISESIASTFSNLGTVIGEALATGGNVMKSAGQALLQGLTGLLSSMGDMLIKMGTAAVLAGTVTKLFGDVTGIGAGLLAIAGGVVLKGVAGGLSKGSGGNANSSTSTGADYSSPAANYGSGNSSGSFSGGTVVFEISGQSLIGVLSNATDKNRRLGGSLAI